MPLPRVPLVLIGIKTGSLTFIISRSQGWQQTNELTDGRKRQIENIMSLTTNRPMVWWRHTKQCTHVCAVSRSQQYLLQYVSWCII